MLRRKPVKRNIDLENYRKAFSILEEDKKEEIKGGVKITKQKSLSPNIIEEKDKPLIIEKRIPYPKEKIVEVEKIIEKPVEKIIEKEVYLSSKKINKKKKKHEKQNKNNLILNYSKGEDIPWLI
jgi:uncharacterized UPF0160 family protein